ncbi:Werner Syndrome-like exonuclease [Dendronephthya gigantea]|uniref:Werner Syndrome-like exonuclease n=1 Tax=Dendronephthya gigantea TaxID=151771 RepID=UPI001069637C|nr:Werner Syndrome-like exonuclease [Dendronephthya gigantea]
MLPRHFKHGSHRNFYKQTSQIPHNNQERCMPSRPQRPYTIRMEIEGSPEQARGVQVTYTNDPIETDAWLRNNIMDTDCRAIGFDMEWRPQFVKKKLGGKENKTAVLQLSTETDSLVCHLKHVKPLPRYLPEVLANENIRKVGCGIRPDVIKLLKDTGLQCKGAVDLAELAKISGYTKEHGQGLKTLANNLLGLELNKPKSVKLSNWEKLPLKQGQIRYAALDAWVGIKLYLHMLKTMDNKANVKSEVDGLFNVEPSDLVVVHCNVCGKKCKGDRKLQEHLANAGHSKCPKCGMMFVFSVTRKHHKKCIGP